MLGEGLKQKDGRSLVVTSGSLERKKEWLEHLKKRIFKMTLQKAKENHDDDNEQTERRFSVSAFTSEHAEERRGASGAQSRQHQLVVPWGVDGGEGMVSAAPVAPSVRRPAKACTIIDPGARPSS